jgi:hypothetical protein
MRRGSKRSASAPLATENTRNGNQCETTAKPANAGEWNFWNSIQ